jgi:small GTP-binding protein
MATHRRDVKVTFIGNGGVGKSALLQRHLSVSHNDGLRVQQFSLDILTAEMTSRIDGTVLAFAFWDTGPADHMQEFLPFYVAHSDVVVVVYSIGNRTSFEASRGMMRMVIDELGKDACVMLVGNKSDLSSRCVSKEEGQKLATSFQARFEETSALEGTNVAQAFRNVEEYLANAAGGVVVPRRTEASMWAPSPLLFPVAVSGGIPSMPIVTTHGEGIFHVVLLGDSRVGKTTFIRTFTRQSQLDRDDGATVETVCVQQHSRVVNGLTVYMWDTPGAVELRSLCVAAIAEANAILVMHDASLPVSLKSGQEWVQRVRWMRSDVPMYLVTNVRSSSMEVSPIDVPCTHCVSNCMKSGDVDRTLAHLVHDANGVLLQELL